MAKPQNQAKNSQDETKAESSAPAEDQASSELEAALAENAELQAQIVELEAALAEQSAAHNELVKSLEQSDVKASVASDMTIKDLAEMGQQYRKLHKSGEAKSEHIKSIVDAHDHFLSGNCSDADRKFAEQHKAALLQLR